jgi:hypothetical protein
VETIFCAAIVKQPGRSVTWETTSGADTEPLEVNVIFTEQQAAAAALKAAESFARGLGACIRLRAAIVVPMRLAIDQPPVSVRFMERLLRDLVGQPDPDGPEVAVHLYVCRNWLGALLQELKPNSLVVIGGRKHWWPTPEIRMARALRANGHRVAVVDFRDEETGSRR